MKNMSNKDFKWKSIGLELEHNSGIMVKAANFCDIIKEENLENIFLLGYYFVSNTHNIEIHNMDDYYKFVKKVSKNNTL